MGRQIHRATLSKEPCLGLTELTRNPIIKGCQNRRAKAETKAKTSIFKHKMKNYELIPLKEVILKVSLSKSSIYRKMAEGSFPKARHLGGGGKAVRWIATEIDQWITDLPKIN